MPTSAPHAAPAPAPQEIKAKFSADIEAVAAGKYDPWMEQPYNAMAAIILMDQFTRWGARGAGGRERVLLVLPGASGASVRAVRPLAERMLLWCWQAAALQLAMLLLVLLRWSQLACRHVL